MNKRCIAECDLLQLLHRTDDLVSLGHSLYGGTAYVGAYYPSPCCCTIAQLVRPSICTCDRVIRHRMAGRPARIIVPNITMGVSLVQSVHSSLHMQQICVGCVMSMMFVVSMGMSTQ